MSWSRRFRVRQFLRGSIWFVPVLGGAAGSLCGIAAAEADRHYSLPEGWSYSAGTAQAVLASVVGASVGLTGFVVTVAVLIVQMATGTFSARYMRIFYRDGLLKAVLAVLVGTLTFSYALLRRVEQNSVPSLGVTLAGFLLSTGVLLFLVFLNRSIHRLRPVAVAALVAKAGRRSFEAMIREAKGPDAPMHLPGAYVGDTPPTLVVATLRAGAVQAMDARGLARFARAHDCLIVVRPAVGDFVPEGAALLEVYGGEGMDASAERRLRSMVVLGVERTIEQDPAFAIRVMVDIAIRALSPAVNDPTTAVQVLDHLGDTLRLFGATSGSTSVRADARSPGLVVRARRWEDIVQAAITEIRLYGGSSVQVVRRLRALLEDLRERVLPEHRQAVEDELARLDATVARALEPLGRPRSREHGGRPGHRWTERPQGVMMVDAMGALAVTTVDLARIQFATTSLYHFLFVPLTLGLAPLVAVMQTLWYRGGDEAWLRLTRFFGTLMLINFAIGVATGLVQEFQFGMNWSIYSQFVGDVFGAPLAIEGLAAFMLESTFLGLWIFGWDRLSRRVHLATVWLFAIGSWASAFFIISANSWMQRPVGSTVTDGRAELTDVWELFSNRFAIWAYIHVLLVGLTTAAVVIFGVSCWHLVRGRNQELFRHAAKLALIVGLPISAVNLGVGSQMGVVVTDYQPMKIASTEAQWDTCQPCAFSLFQIGGFTVDDQTPSFSIQVPHLLSILATLSWDGEVKGMNELQASEAATYGPGDYIPPTRTTYWSMRIMAYAGTLVFLVFALGAFLYRRGSLASRRWFLWLGVLTIPLPYAAALAGWVLSEVGRQPWIVWGLLKTADANSPSVSTATIATSLGVFVALYAALLVVDFVLMRRYARVDPPELGGEGDEFALPAVEY